MRVITAVACLVLVAGCGGFQPFATPFVPRPQLPTGESFPAPVVDDVIERLELAGMACEYAPDSDIPGGWGCFSGNQQGAEARWLQLSIDSEEVGPIRRVLLIMFDGSGQSPDEMNRQAIVTFQEHAIQTFLPEHVRPSDEELLAMVEKNWPVELGDGWLLGFDRSSNNRTLHIVFDEAFDVDVDESGG